VKRCSALLGCLAALSVGCGQSLAPPAAPLTPPTAWCAGTQREGCRSTAEIEGWLGSPELAIVGAASTSTGIQGAKVLTLSVPGAAGPVVFRAKWRAYSTLSPINDPRRELAAYHVQRLFVDPSEYVVPPTHGHCLDLAEYRRHVDPTAQPTFHGFDCVFGMLSYWLENARTPADVYDPELYRESAVYRRSVSNLNLLTFLINHGDSHARQFLMVDRRDGPRVYAVDNSLSFGTFVNTDIGAALDLSRLQVPALPRAGVRACWASRSRLRASFARTPCSSATRAATAS
jgi:hypothetical protein